MRKACKIAIFSLIISIISLLFSLIIISAMNKSAYAADEILLGVDGTCVDAGTQSNPFAISSKEQLIFLSDKINDGDSFYADESKHYQLTCDIVFNAGKELYDAQGNVLGGAEKFIPIGKELFPFKGHFNGNGYTIKGVCVVQEEAGFFGYIRDAVIYNLGIVDGYFKGEDSAGSVACIATNAKIINCFNTSRLSANSLGGIVYKVQSNAVVSNCYNTGVMEATRTKGGIVNSAFTNAIVENSYYKCSNGDKSTRYAFFDNGMVNGDAFGCASIDGDPATALLWEKLNGNIDQLDSPELQLVRWKPSAQGHYACFDNQITHDVTYDSQHNGGADTLYSVEMPTGENVDLTIDASKDGYQFLGWNTAPNATESLQSLTVQDDNIVLYAIFSKIITVDFIDEQTSQQQLTLYNNQAQHSVTLGNILPFDDCVAVGWRCDNGATDPQYNCGDSIDIDADTTFYAVYKKDIEIAFEIDGIDVEQEKKNATIYYNAAGVWSEYTFSLPQSQSVEKQSYNFYKWLAENIEYDECQEVSTSQSMRFTAAYEPKSYKARYYLSPNGEVWREIAVRFGQELTHDLLAANGGEPEMDGERFKGWLCEYTNMPSRDINIYADWEKIMVTYSVSEFWQTPDGDFPDSQPVIMEGYTDSYTKIAAQNKVGFTVQDFDQQQIKGDGTTNIEIYYYRNRYEIRFLATPSDEHAVVRELLFEQEIAFPTQELPTLLGYSFLQWDCDHTTMPSRDVDAVAKFTLNEPIIIDRESIQKEYDGEKLCISLDVVHELESITYQWYKGQEMVSQCKELELVNVEQSGIYYLIATVTDGTSSKQARSADISVDIVPAKVDMSKVSFADKQVVFDGNQHQIIIMGDLPSGVKVTYNNNTGSEIGEYSAKAIFSAGSNYQPIPSMEAMLKIFHSAKSHIEQDPPQEHQEPELKPNSVVITNDKLNQDSLELTVANCTINMCKESISTLKSQANSSTVMLTVDRVENGALKIPNFTMPLYSAIYNLSLFVDNEQVGFSERVEISIPYKLKEKQKPQDIKVWSVQNNKTMAVDDVQYQDEYVTFSSSGFCCIIIGTLDIIKNVDNQDTVPVVANDVLLITGGLSIIGLIIITVVIIKSVRKKKKA